MQRNLLNGGPVWLFLLAALWGAGIFWLAPHPPMVDLPQHAAQVALLRDLLQGASPWADFFRVNWITPYLIGYGLALLFGLVRVQLSGPGWLHVLLGLAATQLLVASIAWGRSARLYAMADVARDDQRRHLARVRPARAPAKRRFWQRKPRQQRDEPQAVVEVPADAATA